jgi:hypothetical protein
LFAHGNEILAGTELVLSLNAVDQGEHLASLLFLKLVDQVKGGLLIVGHVLVPGLRKFYELHALRILDVD